jgi:hypothetical protein
MQLPITLWDFGVWLAVNSILLLVTSEFINSFNTVFFNLNKDILRLFSFGLGILFFIITIVNRYLLLIGAK